MVVPAERSTTFSCDTSQRYEAISIKLKLCGGKKKSAFGDLWACVIHVTRNSPVLFEIFQYGLKPSSDPLTGQQVCRHKDVCRNSQHRSWGGHKILQHLLQFILATLVCIICCVYSKPHPLYEVNCCNILKSPPVTLTGTLLGS